MLIQFIAPLPKLRSGFGKQKASYFRNAAPKWEPRTVLRDVVRPPSTCDQVTQPMGTWHNGGRACVPTRDFISKGSNNEGSYADASRSRDPSACRLCRR